LNPINNIPDVDARHVFQLESGPPLFEMNIEIEISLVDLM
jgi:hypothetical protein